MTDMPGKFSIYVFVHESGHMIFGWPDLYWYGDYCTMGNRANDLNPVAINDFYRADQGWIPFVDVTSEDVSLETTKPNEVCYRYKNPARPEKEGLVWSYVRNTGRDKVLKGSGLLMQHYDFSIEGNSAADKLTLRIVHANAAGKSNDNVKDQWPNPGSDANAFFKSGTYSEFSDDKYPAIRWYNGSKTGLKITDIGTPGETMQFCIGENCPAQESSSSVPAVLLSSSSSAPVVSSSSNAPNPASSSNIKSSSSVKPTSSSQSGSTAIISNFRKVSKYGIPENKIFNVLGKPVGQRTASGELPKLPKGIYVEFVK